MLAREGSTQTSEEMRCDNSLKRQTVTVFNRREGLPDPPDTGVHRRHRQVRVSCLPRSARVSQTIRCYIIPTVQASSKISKFIERAKASGASEQSIVGILTTRGWPEKEVYEALAAQYEQLTGLEVPRHGSSGTAAKDAFFYLLVFSTLATWTIGLGWLTFTLIDRWLADTLFSEGYYQGAEMYSIASALASILVAYPIYLLVSRSVVQEERRHPEKLDSPVRKWLTYMALVFAAGVFMGDLIAALTTLLRGEVTSRFLAKTFVVLVISGGVFFYYFAGVRKSAESGARGRLSRDPAMALVSALTIVVMVVCGFWHLGAPKKQRMLRADSRRVQDLYQLSYQCKARWNSDGHKLPEHLDELANVALADPITRKTYEYHTKEGSQYELCATFSLENEPQQGSSRRNNWSHPAGRYCFQMDAAQSVENPYIYLPN